MTTDASAEECADLERLVLDGVTADGSREDARTQAVADDEATVRRAARTVWRQCNQHGCTEGPDCTHTHHRRDVHYFRVMLAMQGIPLAADAEWDAWFRDVYTAS